MQTYENENIKSRYSACIFPTQALWLCFASNVSNVLTGYYLIISKNEEKTKLSRNEQVEKFSCVTVVIDRKSGVYRLKYDSIRIFISRLVSSLLYLLPKSPAGSYTLSSVRLFISRE